MQRFFKRLIPHIISPSHPLSQRPNGRIPNYNLFISEFSFCALQLSETHQAGFGLQLSSQIIDSLTFKGKNGSYSDRTTASIHEFPKFEMSVTNFCSTFPMAGLRYCIRRSGVTIRLSTEVVHLKLSIRLTLPYFW